MDLYIVHSLISHSTFMAMILRKDKEIYHLKDSNIDLSRLQNTARETGFKFIEVEDANGLLSVLESKEPNNLPENAADKSTLLSDNINQEYIKKYIHQLHGQLPCLIALMEKLHIGFMISNGALPLIVNPIARNILQADPESIRRHPIESNILEKHKQGFISSLKQLSKREIRQYTDELHLYPPSSNPKAVYFIAKTLDLYSIPLVAEYLIEQPNGNTDQKALAYERAIINELHRILLGLVGITALNIRRQHAENEQEAAYEGRRARFNLTKREAQILQLIYEGYTSQKIAEKLYISKRTVESHRANILHKANARNTAEMIRFAIDFKIL